MDDCYFSTCGVCDMGMLVDLNIGSRYNWSGCNNGWHCSSFGILFHHALVENTMAKLNWWAWQQWLIADRGVGSGGGEYGVQLVRVATLLVGDLALFGNLGIALI
ncbi:unnamed protein product [Ilex paraguariensis]|uniref:Uncharacterized protein n=1 Tax=Ilex paraguariensis TaxID=185542 RepID=A0ABC8UR77_9AQUA